MGKQTCPCSSCFRQPQLPPSEPLWNHLTLHPHLSSLFKINSWPLSCLEPLQASKSDNSWWLLLCGSPYFCTLPYTGAGIFSPRLACLTIFPGQPGPCRSSFTDLLTSLSCLFCRLTSPDVFLDGGPSPCSSHALSLFPHQRWSLSTKTPPGRLPREGWARAAGVGIVTPGE